MSDTTRYTFAADSAQFSVDPETRVISGLIVPFGVKPIDGRTVSFKKGDIGWSNYKAVKVNLDHNISSSFGYGTNLVETDAGILGTFKVADGPRGDEALALAQSGVYDGLSVSLYKPEGKDKFHLSHVALTAEPAFDEARVTKVAATAAADHNTEGARAMGDQTTETEAPAAQDFTPVTDAIKEGFAALNLPPRETVAAGDGVQREESPYRFNGTRGAYDFSTDLFGALSGQGEGMARVQDFIRETFAGVSTGNVNDVNPTGYRPDLYVDYIEKDAPVYSAIQSGSINDATPFVVPKFSSSSDEVADHVEGTEPANDATFVTDAGTVTPAALSGRAVINREVVDAGGNPVVSALIWKQMNRKYAEALETKAAALMNSGAFAELGAAIAAGTADEALLAAFKKGLVGANFIDGSGSWNFALGHRDLYSGLAGANDTTGRPLLPVLSSVNADGSAGGKFRALDIGGYAMLPAGSLGATETNMKSYIGDSDGVLFVNSAPKRIDLAETVATVSFGLFGYWAGAVLDAARIRKITYDPTV